jgi:hypothetical protein
MGEAVTTPPEPTEPAPDGSLTERVGKLETGQESIAGKVDRILGLLDKPGTPAADPGTTTADPAPADMGEQMRQAVRDVHAEAVAAEAAKPKPEQRPREAGQPFRQRLAEVVHGKEPRKP